MYLESPLLRTAWRAYLPGLRVNISRTVATFSERDVDGRQFLAAFLTERVIISFEWQFFIVSERSGIPYLHRTPPSLHKNNGIPHLIACSNLHSLPNRQTAGHLCLLLRILSLMATACTTDAWKIKSFLMTYMYTLFSLWFHWYKEFYSH
jgi:hypothetical protein